MSGLASTGAKLNMSRGYDRTDRVGDFLRSELARLIQLELRDPRVGMVNITAVEVSRDLSHAKVFVTVVGKSGPEEITPTLDGLNNAAGFLRSRVAAINHMRTTPRLRFVYDDSVLRGSHLTRLIESVNPPPEPKEPLADEGSE